MDGESGDGGGRGVGVGAVGCWILYNLGGRPVQAVSIRYWGGYDARGLLYDYAGSD